MDSFNIAKDRARVCVTHHYACDCREYLFQEIMMEAKKLIQEAIDSRPTRETPGETMYLATVDVPAFVRVHNKMQEFVKRLDELTL